MNLLSFFMVALTLMLSGCQIAYIAPNGKPAANLTFIVKNDSTKTTGRHIVILKHANVECKADKQGSRLGAKLFAGSKEVFGPVKVLAGEPFAFSISYGESRFAQNRDCAVTASFTPHAEHSYLINFSSVDNVGSCNLEIEDSSQGIPLKVEHLSPEYSCVSSFAGKVKNGQPGRLNWTVQ
jgi:hypothetical protein